MRDNSQPNSSSDGARVKNAADRDQLKDAKRTLKDQAKQEALDLIAVLATPEGRRLVWRVLAHCKTFESVWAPSSLISYNSGRQDVGHFLLDEITRANPDALLQMMKENRKETEQ